MIISAALIKLAAIYGPQILESIVDIAVEAAKSRITG